MLLAAKNVLTSPRGQQVVVMGSRQGIASHIIEVFSLAAHHLPPIATAQRQQGKPHLLRSDLH
jgi:hypothetical protein